MRAHLLIILAIFFCLLTNLEARTWTSLDGKTMEAEFVKADGPKVTIRRSDGKTFTVELNKFSEADRKFVALKLKENGAGDKSKAPQPFGKISDPKDGDKVEHKFEIKGRTRNAPKGFVAMLFSRGLRTNSFFPQHEYTKANRSFTLKIYHPLTLSGEWKIHLYVLPEADADKLTAWHMKSAEPAKEGVKKKKEPYDKEWLKKAIEVASVKYTLKPE